MSVLASKNKTDQNIFLKILLICLKQVYNIFHMLAIKWRLEILTVIFFLSFIMVIVFLALFGLIKGKGDFLWFFQEEHRILSSSSIILIPLLIFIYLKSLDLFIQKKCSVLSNNHKTPSIFNFILVFQYIFFSILLLVFLIPVFSGSAYNFENIGTTFITLLYHIQSLVKGEVPFWFSESGLGYSLPLAQDLTRYVPSYIMFFKPHHYFFGIFIVLHIAFSAIYLRKLFKLFKVDGLFTPMLIISLFASGMLSKTLLASWMPTYFMALIWMPVLLYYTILFAQSNKYSQLRRGFALGFFLLLAFYAIYMRLLIIIFLFLGLAFLLFYRHAKHKPLIVFLISIIFFLGALDKIHNIYVEVSDQRLPQSTAFAPNKYRLELINQFFKPFFIPSPKELQTYISEYGSQGIKYYIIANLGLTPSVFKVFSPGLVLTFLFSLGGYYSFKKSNMDQQKIILLGIGSIIFGLLPVSLFNNMTGHWLTEPVLITFLIIGAAIGLKHLIAHYNGNIIRMVTGLILLQAFLLIYTFLPMVVHLTTGQNILWYNFKQTFSGYGVPTYGFGSDYQHFGTGNLVDGLKRYSNPQYRVLFTEGFIKQTWDSPKRLESYIKSKSNREENQSISQLDERIFANYISPDRFKTRCNYHQSFLTLQGVNSFNAYPKGKYLGDVTNDYIWPGLYQYNSKDYLIENKELLEILGIKTIFAVEGEDVNPAYKKQETLYCDSDVVVDVLSNPNALKLGFFTDYKAGELENVYQPDCPPPPRYAPIGSSILNERIEKGLWPPHMLLCQDMSKYRNRILTGKDGEIAQVRIVSNGLFFKMNSSKTPRLLNISQIHRPGWKAWDEYKNELPVLKGHGGLLSILIQPGVTEILIKNRPILRVILYYSVFMTMIIFFSGMVLTFFMRSSVE